MDLTSDIVILAAGSSSRLGSPKQLLPYKQRTFLQHAIDKALASVVQRVVVVVREHTAASQPAASNSRLSVIINEQSQEGIASSIRCGLQYLLTDTASTQHVLFMVCDQPYLTTELLNKLVTLQKETGKPIVASEYAGTAGIPAIFAREMFPALLQLTGDTGAKKIMMQRASDMLTVPFPKGEIDIDTEADYQQLVKPQPDK